MHYYDEKKPFKHWQHGVPIFNTYLVVLTFRKVTILTKCPGCCTKTLLKWSKPSGQTHAFHQSDMGLTPVGYGSVLYGQILTEILNRENCVTGHKLQGKSFEELAPRQCDQMDRFVQYLANYYSEDLSNGIIKNFQIRIHNLSNTKKTVIIK